MCACARMLSNSPILFTHHVQYDVSYIISARSCSPPNGAKHLPSNYAMMIKLCNYDSEGIYIHVHVYTVWQGIFVWHDHGLHKLIEKHKNIARTLYCHITLNDRHYI